MSRLSRLDNRTRGNWGVDAIVLLGGILAAVSGVYFLYFPSGGSQGGRNALYGVSVLFERAQWHDIHMWGGLLMIGAAAVHFLLHWAWVKTMARRVWLAMTADGCSLSRGSRTNVAINTVLALSFLVTALSGIYFLFVPEGGFQGGRNPGWDPMFLVLRTTWDLIHTWSGTFMVAAAVGHFWIHWRWVVNVTKRLLLSAVPQSRARDVRAEAETGL